MDTPAPDPQKLSWGRLLIIYPAIIVAGLGALPTVWQAWRAWRLDVAYTKVYQATEQQHLWERNLACLSARPVYAVDGPHGSVGVTLCRSGDALLRYEAPNKTTYTWVPYPRHTHTSSLLSTAQARDNWEVPEYKAKVLFGVTLCAVQHGNIILRIAVTQEGTLCILEHISATTGKVLSTLQVGCATACTNFQRGQVGK